MNEDAHLEMAYEDRFIIEDEELDDVYDDLPVSWMRWDCHSQDDGQIFGRVSTNDDRDAGYPTEYADWEVRYKNMDDFLKHCSNGSGPGVAMRREVYLDGNEVVNGKITITQVTKREVDLRAEYGS